MSHQPEPVSNLLEPVMQGFALERHKRALYAYLRQSGTWVSPDHARALWGEIYPPFDDADRTDLFPLYIVRCRQLDIAPSRDSADAFVRVYFDYPKD
jgi:hypothetical protein